ncbi:YfaZ family outer membrane protein [Paraferrimonas sp. SM1919]|uniref:YfaZ family outer membrane protein n=1 Tax=Paraferrimonas sp. SM1919 TaxID=2662263 RepID=UPI0013D736C3|nr:YfaZ family outer membrane protein [Paraferrimonas sp. SM1919]
MTKMSLVAALVLASTTTYAQTEADIELNDNKVAIAFASTIGENATGSFGFRYNENTGKSLFAELSMAHKANKHQFDIGIRATQFWNRLVDNGSTASIVLGYSYPFTKELSWYAHGLYTPSVLAFGSIDRHHELGSRLQYQFSPKMAVFAGYRNTQLKVNQTNYEFDDNWFIGANIRF